MCIVGEMARCGSCHETCCCPCTLGQIQYEIVEAKQLDWKQTHQEKREEKMSHAAAVLKLVGLSSSGSEGSADNAVIVQALKAANRQALLGQNEVEEIEVGQWLSHSQQAVTADSVAKLNDVFASKSYLVGQRFTVADVAVYQQLVQHNQISTLDQAKNVARWVDHIQHLCEASAVVLHKFEQAPVVIPLPVAEVKKEAVPAAAVPPPAPAANEGKKEDVKTEKKEEKKEEKKGGDKKEAKKEEKKEEAAATGDADLDPSKLEIRVGLVVKCWNHADSEKLLCEEIDLGEGTNRSIASGIRAHYTAEQVQGRKVLVLSNLKERSIAGFKSQGMVLCAVNEDRSSVVLVEPPANANVGDRVVFTGFTGEPATPAQVAKKKIFETLSPFVST